MNLAIIVYFLGTVLEIEAALLLLPALVGLILGESTWYYFIITALIGGVIGFAMAHKKPENRTFYLKEGCVVTALSWIVMSVVGCLPFLMSGSIPNFTDALFETISGFTTTGASILNDVEALDTCMLFWRSFTHWIGGMGVLVFLLSIVSLSGGSDMNLMRAESPGPTVGKLVPKVRQTASLLYKIYAGMTFLCFFFLFIGGMPFLEAVMIAFGTAGTGGFGVRNSSCGDYSAYLQWVISIFMLLFGVNFNLYYLMIMRRFKKAFNIEEVKVYFGIVLAAVVFIFIDIYDRTQTVFKTLTDVVFQVATLTTSTGFSTCDFDLWPSASKMVLIGVMLVGACAGSTGGGIKVSRILLLVKSVFREFNAYLHPKSVKTVQMDEETVDNGTLLSIGVYLLTFILVMFFSVLLISLEGRDLETNFTAVLATLNNMGPGFHDVGPTQNFFTMTGLSKYVLMFDMLAGRLELFPMLILFQPVLWKETIELQKHRKRKRR